MVIDHHVSEDDLGATVFKDSSAEATGMLVMKAISALGCSYTPEVADGLVTAIAMDTGWFRHSNTRAGTLRAVADLIDAGARVDDIYRKLFERNTLGRLKLMGETLLGDANRPGWKNRLRHDIAPRSLAHGCDPARFGRPGGLHGRLRGVEVGMLFIEQARGA